MSHRIHELIAALASADVWDAAEINESPVPETIATLREYAFTMALRGSVAERRPATVVPCDVASR